LGDAFSLFGAGRQEFKKRGCERIVVVGHSLGGALAALVGARVTTFPVSAATFNAPGCKGFERAGRWVDEDDRRLADTLDRSVQAFGDKNLNPVARVGIAAGGLVAATAQVGQLAARRTMESFVVHGRPSIALPSGNARNVHNVQAVSRLLRSGEFVSGMVYGHIGNAPHKVQVNVADPLRAHMIGPLLDALKVSVVGAIRI
jgi:pimeloyl-ACP methyl ester carboxylesterase